MPELPEVESLARSLRGRIIGRRLLVIECRFPGVLEIADAADRGVTGTRLVGVRRRGKLLLLDLDDERVLSVHLRMTGNLTVVHREIPLVPHTHVIVSLDGDEELRFSDPRRFGRVGLHTRETLAATPFLRRLGPEPFDLDAAALAWALWKKTAPIKNVLLDQHVVAGVGNIYADEILHRCRLHPQLKAGTLKASELVALRSALREVLREAIDSGGSTIRDYRSLDGDAGGFQLRHRVFGRTGRPCPECGEKIRKIVVGGRGTHFCPRCQPRRRRERFTRPESVALLAGESQA